MRTKKILIGLVALLVVFAIGLYAFGWCDGECEKIECGPNDPCAINGKQYITGNICANESTVCDDGYIFDCHCVTRIIGVGQNLKPDCNCE